MEIRVYVGGGVTGVGQTQREISGRWLADLLSDPVFSCNPQYHKIRNSRGIKLTNENPRRYLWWVWFDKTTTKLEIKKMMDLSLFWPTKGRVCIVLHGLWFSILTGNREVLLSHVKTCFFLLLAHTQTECSLWPLKWTYCRQDHSHLNIQHLVSFLSQVLEVRACCRRFCMDDADAEESWVIEMQVSMILHP